MAKKEETKNDCADTVQDTIVRKPSAGTESGEASYSYLICAWSADQTAVGRFEIIEDTVDVGRDSISFEAGLSADARMSRKHFRVGIDDGAWVVDLGSANGAFLDGRRLDGRTDLGDGDLIRAGESLFVFRLGAMPGKAPEGTGCFVGISAQASQIRTGLAAAARSGMNILLLGDSGTGKEVAADLVAAVCGKSASAVVKLNCATLGGELWASELFGHEKGAFTGASAKKTGAVARADGGVLFLDEIAEMPPEVQARLLRVLETGEYSAVGSERTARSRFLLVSATSAPMEHLVTQGRFRADLYARIAHFELCLPSLASRREDIGLLAAHFLGCTGLRAQDVEALMLHGWPLNVRELKTLCSGLGVYWEAAENGLRLTAAGRKRMASTARMFQEKPDRADQAAAVPHKSRKPPDRARLEELLLGARGNISRVAEQLGCHRFQVYRWASAMGLDRAAFREKP